MRPVLIVDCETVVVDDLTLLRQLRRSVDLTAKDRRWLNVNDRTPVIWEDHLTEWGSLTQNEKMCCDFNEAGLLEGGYPF